MKTNLIQNFVHTQNTHTSKPKKEAPDFDIHHELANKAFIRPLEGQGRLVKDNILYTPVNMAKSFAYDIKALKGSVNGEANDHQLGKLNDLGMKLGGLGIAGFLMTKRQTPLTKTMEFVGLGSFFASMALWPKIAIQIPARLIHGFNVQQQYEDSFGRKKPFYQDAQFLPWDLYSDDEINKIGNRMGVPKDIPNRREFIQEKMKKIATQNNTLWMLTAGFATPIMSALICNQLEKPLAKPLSTLRNNNNDNILNKLSDSQKAFKDNEIQKTVENIISINQNKPLTDELIEELSQAMTKGFDPITRKFMNRDLKSLLGADSTIVNDNALNAISADTKKVFLAKGIDTKIVDALIPDAQNLRKYFDFEKGVFGNELTPVKVEKTYQMFTKDIRKAMLEYNSQNPENPITKAVQKKIINILTLPEKENPIYKGLTQERYALLDTQNQTKVRVVTNAMNKLKAEINALDTYILHKVGQAAETTLADFWNGTVSSFVKTLNISPKQLSETRGDRLLTADLLHTSLNNAAADKTAYTKITTDLISKIGELDNLVKKTDIDDGLFSNPQEMTKLEKQLDKMLSSFEIEIKKLPDNQIGDMELIFDHFIGPRNNIRNPIRGEKGSLKNLYKTMARERLIGVKSAFFRMLNTLDTYRRVAVGDMAHLRSISQLPRELKEQVVELAKMTGLKAHTADYLTKFFALRNPHPNMDDMSEIALQNGKTIYKYFDKTVEEGKVNLTYDRQIFRGVMDLACADAISPDTEKAFGNNTSLLNEFMESRNQMYRKLGTYEYLEGKNIKTAVEALSTTDKEMFNIVGAAMDEVVSNYGKQVHNTRKWMRIFAPAGAALLAVTVLSQFMFGKMKPPASISETQKGQRNA